MQGVIVFKFNYTIKLVGKTLQIHPVIKFVCTSIFLVMLHLAQQHDDNIVALLFQACKSQA